MVAGCEHAVASWLNVDVDDGVENHHKQGITVWNTGRRSRLGAD